MRNLFFIACLLFSISILSQEKEVGKEDKPVPVSIFAANSLDFQTNYGNMAHLRLNGYKFMIVDFFNNDFSFSNAGRVKLDLRNFGRHISFDDLSDNYNKAKLNSFDVSRNTNHFIWSMWDTRIQKQWQQDLPKTNR